VFTRSHGAHRPPILKIRALAYGASLLALLSACGDSAPPPRPAIDVQAVARANCERDRAELVRKFEEQVRQKQHNAAVATLRNCATRLQDEALQAKVRQADIASYMEVINNPKALPFDRATSMQQLARDYPELGKPYEARAKQLFEQAERQAAAAGKAQRKREGVAIGMTAEDVLASSWGRHERVNRTITASGEREQWVYPGFNYLYIVNGRVAAIQTR
jgi:hypothetical protein